MYKAISISAKFGICAVIGLNETLVEAKIRTCDTWMCVFQLGLITPSVTMYTIKRAKHLKGSGYRKITGVWDLATVRRWFQTVAIDVCFIFNVAVVCSSKYFRFLFVKLC